MTRLRFGLMGWLALVLLGIASTSWAIQDRREFTLQSAAGSALNGSIAYVEGFTSVGLDLTITNTATVTFEGSVAGTGWTSVTCILSSDTSGLRVTTATASGLYQCNVSGLSVFRARISAWTSGTVTAFARASEAPAPTSGGVSLATLLACEDQTNSLCRTSGGAVRSTVVASSITTDTTSTAQSVPIGTKTIYGSVDGTGAVTQTQKIYGGLTSGVTATTGELLGTLTLSGTTHAHASFTTTTPWLYYIVVSSSTSGTSATGVVTAMY